MSSSRNRKKWDKSAENITPPKGVAKRSVSPMENKSKKPSYVSRLV